LGDYETARRHYAASLAAYRNYEDPWSLVFALEDVAILMAATGDGAAAYELLGAADALRDASDIPRSPSRQQEIEHELEGLGDNMSQDQRDARRAHGRTMSSRAALDYAIALCASPAAVAT